MMRLLRSTAPGMACCWCCTARRSPRTTPTPMARWPRGCARSVGPDVPIGVAMDLHGNQTQRLIENTDAVVFFRTNPHLDARPRARECAEIIVRTVRGEIRPVQAMETPPLVINIIKQYHRRRAAAEPDGGMRSGDRRTGHSLGLGRAGLPVRRRAGDGDVVRRRRRRRSRRLARETARWLARRAWDRRAEFDLAGPGPEEALRRARWTRRAARSC